MTVRCRAVPLSLAVLLVLAGCGGDAVQSGGGESTPTSASASASAKSSVTSSDPTRTTSPRKTSSATTSSRPSTTSSSSTPDPATTSESIAPTAATAAPPPAASGPPPAGGPAPATTGTKPWRDLRAGECIADVPEGTFTDVGLIDCASPHEAQALSGVRAVSLQGRPAAEAAQAQCDTILAESGIADPGLVAAPIVETQGTLLARAVCLVVDAGGAPLTGSVVTG